MDQPFYCKITNPGQARLSSQSHQCFSDTWKRTLNMLVASRLDVQIKKLWCSRKCMLADWSCVPI